MTVTTKTVSSGYSTGTINENFQTLEDYINNNLLNRDGTSVGESNQMEVGLDMNSNFVYNLPKPVLEHQAARLRDVQNAIAGADSANLITFTPYGNISSGNVQGALQEVSEALDQRVIYRDTVTNFKALDASAGQLVHLLDSSRGGKFIVRSGTPPSDPSEGIYIVLDNGNYAERVVDGDVFIEWFGAVADWNGTTGTDNSVALSAAIPLSPGKTIKTRGGSFYFGAITGTGAKFEVTSDTDFDWCGAELVCAGDVNQSGGNTFVRFLDCRGNFQNYKFDDVNFAFGNVSRGVIPVEIRNSLKNTKGYTLGPMHIERGQSLLTASSADPVNARASGIKFEGACTGGSCYYGVNLADNGDDFSGEYHVETANRIIFPYGVDGVDIKCSSGTLQAASANILVSANGAGFPATRNVKIDAEMQSLNGPVVMADQPSADGTGIYENIDISIFVGALGANISQSDPIVRVGAYDSMGALFTSEKTVAADNIKINLTSPDNLSFDIPTKVYTPSPSYGLFHLSSQTIYSGFPCNPKNASGVYRGPVIYIDGKYIRDINGDMTAANQFAEIPAKYLSNVARNGRVSARLTVTADNNYSTGVITNREYLIIGSLNSSGAFTLIRATQVATDSTGGVTPTITVSGVTSGLRVSMDSYTDPSATMRLSLEAI